MLVSPTLRNGFNTTQWNPACPFHATLNPDLPDEPKKRYQFLVPDKE
jgi:hypothetical protein